MLTFDSIPQARVVRKGGHEFAPPPAPPHHEPSVIRDHVRSLVSVALGLWPLTCVVLLMVGLMWMAGFSGAP
ncbi:MAG: hypothetical protein ABI591_14210 [Kofleriaceae bacterium]